MAQKKSATAGTNKRAVFLDRDGTINKDVNYCSSIENFVILPGVPEAIRLLNQNGFLVIVITNQSGIARGYFSEEKLSQIHTHMKNRLVKDNAHIDAIYYCPHHPDENCDCRKPLPKLILQAAADYKIDLTKSFMIGDDPKDVRAGNNAGCKSILLNNSPTPSPLLKDLKPDYISSGLLDAAKWIISKR